MLDLNFLRPAPASRYLEVVQSLLTSSSFPLFVLYLLVVSQARRWKRNTQPLDLGKVVFVYNAIISVINVYCFLGFFYQLVKADSIYERKANPDLARVYFVYWLTKVVELLDTIFMLLRHKFRQISTLHVYHHASMLLLSDLGCTQYAWAAFAMPLMLNSLVHVFLYCYYALTSLGYRPAWKQRLTEFQIVQFIIDLVHAVIGLVYYNFCVWSLFYGFSMLYLFSSFYYTAYIKDSKTEKRQ